MLKRNQIEASPVQLKCLNNQTDLVDGLLVTSAIIVATYFFFCLPGRVNGRIRLRRRGLAGVLEASRLLCLP